MHIRATGRDGTNQLMHESVSFVPAPSMHSVYAPQFVRAISEMTSKNILEFLTPHSSILPMNYVH